MKKLEESFGIWKRAIAFLLLLPLIFALAACKTEDPSVTDPTESQSIITLNRDGGIYTIDTEKCTITFWKHTYEYEFVGTASDYKVTIIYPDGQSYVVENGGCNKPWNGGAYVYVFQLVDALKEALFPKTPEAPPQPSFFDRFGYGILLLALAALFLIFPETLASWKLYFWAKDAEPSEFAILFYRGLGVFCALVGVISLLS